MTLLHLNFNFSILLYLYSRYKKNLHEFLYYISSSKLIATLLLEISIIWFIFQKISKKGPTVRMKCVALIVFFFKIFML